MENLTDAQRKAILKLKDAQLNELLAVLPVLNEINDNLKAIAEKETPVMEMPEPPEVQKIEIAGVSMVTLKGDPLRWEDLTDEQKEELRGEPGKDYILTPEDKKAIAKSIPVPIVEKVIEKTEVIHEQPVVTNEVKEVAVTDTGEQIIDKINDDESEKKIKREKVEGLDEELKRIENLPRGGGVSAMGVRQAFKYIFHTETPSGLIDGSNTTYMVQNTIFAVVSFSLNGEVIAQLPNYTVTNKTITFSSPLPADYSGSDFEIKYIG